MSIFTQAILFSITSFTDEVLTRSPPPATCRLLATPTASWAWRLPQGAARGLRAAEGPFPAGSTSDFSDFRSSFSLLSMHHQALLWPSHQAERPTGLRFLSACKAALQPPGTLSTSTNFPWYIFFPLQLFTYLKPAITSRKTCTNELRTLTNTSFLHPLCMAVFTLQKHSKNKLSSKKKIAKNWHLQP